MAIRKIRTGAVLFSCSDEREYEAEWFPTLELARNGKTAATALLILDGAWNAEAEEESPSLWISAVGPDGPNADESHILVAHDEDYKILEVVAFEEEDDPDDEFWGMEERHPEGMVCWVRHPQN